MVEKDPETGKFVKAPVAAKAEPAVVHPALRPRKRAKKVSDKSRRTTVRSLKLINATNPNRSPQLVQLPIEPSHNNAGALSDPTIPIRFYLNKGFQWPHEFDPEKYPGIYCAILDCWDFTDGDSERCKEHDAMFEAGLIRYATAAKEYKE